jgi:pimeloyl-ACP methyl ester carboxylesterase
LKPARQREGYNLGGQVVKAASKIRSAVVLSIAVGFALLSSAAGGQSITDVIAPTEPLIVKQQGSFFVGGRQTQSDATGWDQTPPVSAFGSGDVTVDQMYVQFQIPITSGSKRKVPLVFVHGCCLTSKTWETTPDGRMGWYEYFTRLGYPTYLAEQSGRARSGFNGTIYNEVKLGQKPPSEQPFVLIATYQFAWSIFRFGPSYGEAWPDEQFPMNKVDELFKQVIPDLILTEVPDLAAEFANPTTDNPTVTNMAALARDLGGAVLVGHSQSSGFPTQAALKDPTGVRGIIQLETGCFADLTPDQVTILAKIPILIVVGDHFSTAQPTAACTIELRQINAAGGDMTFVALPDLGLIGNSHMFMQDKNNIEVADIIQKWISGHVERKRRGG